MRLHLCGVRGSTQAPGPEFVRVGGHTSCVALAHDGEPPTLVLDAGTGIRRLWDLLDRRPFRGTILLGHLHWDHTHGLPFFRAGDDPSARVEVHVPTFGDHEPAPHQTPDADALTRLAGGMAPPYFPITPDQLRGDWRFLDLDEGLLEVEGFRVLVREIPHKGGRTFGFRVEDDTGVVAYLSDHHPVSLGLGPDGFGPYHPAALELADGADVLLHDSQYTAAEFPARASFGHSTIDYTVGLGAAAGVGQVLLYHHDPARTDAELDAILARLASATVPVDAAREGVVVEVGARAPLVG